MKETLLRLLEGQTLSSGETMNIMLGIAEGKYSEAQIASLLTCLRMRGVTSDELIGFRAALMQTRVPVDFAPYKPIDIVGTGGDGKNTFNISTCACFVVAGAGYKVAKHGNYAATSVSGASTVMERHGVKFTNDASKLYKSLEECNMAYLHAPLFNPALKSVAGVRKALQFPTVFNLLGPIVNPCQPPYQLLGVADLAQMRLYSDVLTKLGIGFSVINSVDGYDEVSLTGDFKLTSPGFEHVYAPEDLGFQKVAPEHIYGGKTPDEAAGIFDEVLGNAAAEVSDVQACAKASAGADESAGIADKRSAEMAGGQASARKSVVLANAAIAIRTICPEKSVEDCLGEARESLESGKALRTFRKFVELNS